VKTNKLYLFHVFYQRMKKAFLLFSFIITGILTPLKAIAGSNDSALRIKATQWMSNANGIRFLENKGQMMDMQRKAVNNVLFKAGAGGVDVYVTTDGLSYVFVDLKRYKKKNNSPFNFKQHNDSITGTYCRADMQLVGATIRKENIVQEGESTERNDYYYGDICPNGILGVHSYEKVTINNIYPGIDWVLHSGKNGLKYDFIVHPGANPSQIKLKYKWTGQPQLQDNGSLKIYTPMGNITEGTPVSYSDGKQMQTTYSIADSEIHFNVGDYNSTQTLTIDPTLVWATYYAGSNGTGDILGMHEDGTNVWLGGFESAANFPTVNPGNGAYFQGTLTAAQYYPNVAIIKFTTAGICKWATYYGGSTYEWANSIYSDGKNIWLTGLTASNNFPTYNPGNGAYYQGTFVPGIDAFILKFDTAGVRKWATYYGEGDETGNSIQSDGKNVWVTGTTESYALPIYNPGGGAYFQGSLGGNENAFLLKFDTSGVCKWATYYGGNARIEGGYSIYSDGTNVWVTGVTGSSNFPTLNPGNGAYFQAGLSSGVDAFLLKFDTAGVRKWATYYGGNQTDFGYSIQSDGNNVWVTGQTTSLNFPVYNPGGGAYFQGTLAAVSNGNAFILKFDTSGVSKWATYYGGDYYDEGFSIQSDGTNVWVSGGTGSTNFPLLKPQCGFYQDTLGRYLGYSRLQDSSNDVFILQFSTACERKWATYYGTDQEDDGSFVWSDRKNLYIAGDADNEGYPMVNPGGGAYQWDSTIRVGTGNENPFVGKFIISGTQAGINSEVAICKGDSTQLSVSGGISYSWSPSTGLNATNIPNPVSSPPLTTTYVVSITDTGGCAGSFTDTVKVTVDTFNLKNISITKDTAICIGSSITLSAGGGISYQWNTGSTTDSISVKNDTGTHIYSVIVSDGLCKADTNVTVTVKPKPTGNVNGSLFICKGNTTTLAAWGGTSYKWSTGQTTSTITISPSSNTKYSVTIIQNGCVDSLSELVSINPSPSINVCCDSTVNAGQSVQLISSGGGKYLWSPSTGLSCDTCSNPVATDSVTTWYYEIITSDSGCKSKDSVLITIHSPTPPNNSDTNSITKPCGEVFIPNVFAPNETMYNNILYVRSTCIASMDFLIFDRWGNKVFESQNLNDGWDGTYKGQAMNTATFVWVLKATLQDGTSIDKKGNVTLVR